MLLYRCVKRVDILAVQCVVVIKTFIIAFCGITSSCVTFVIGSAKRYGHVNCLHEGGYIFASVCFFVGLSVC